MSSLVSALWREAREAALGLVFSGQCALCEWETNDSPLRALCPGCLDALPRVRDPRCAVCGEWFVGRIAEPFRCTNCADRRFAFEFATAPFQARSGMRELIHRFKYERQLWLGPTLGRLLMEALRGPHADPRLGGVGWTIVPVPLHPRRMREREFNQAAELAAVVGRLTSLPVAEILRRVRYTTGQASLDRNDRLANLHGAFRLRPYRFRGAGGRHHLQNRAVLLVDDVFTTGATMEECARVLREEAGVRRVAALTLARG